MSKSILDFARKVYIRAHAASDARSLLDMGLSSRDTLALAADVRERLGPNAEGAVITAPARAPQGRYASLWHRLGARLAKLEVAEAAQAQQQQQGRKIKSLKAKYAGATVETKATTRERFRRAGTGHNPSQIQHAPAAPTVGHKSHSCTCKGTCGDCQTDACFRLGDEVQRLDALLATAASELGTSAALRQVKDVLALAQGKSLDESAPSAQEVCVRIKMLTLRDQRNEAFDQWASAGCSLIR